MGNYIARTSLLTRFLLGGSRMFATGELPRSDKPLRKIGMAFAYAFLFLYLGGIVVFFTYQITNVLASVGMAFVLPELLIALYANLVFIFGMYYIVSVFYFSEESTYLLGLPFRSSEIVGAKFIQTLIYEYVLAGLVFLPAAVTYGIVVGESISYYLMLIPLVLLVPVIPLVLMTILISLLMLFVPIAKNKDRLATLMNVLLLVVILGGSMVLSQPMNEEDLLEMLLSGGGISGLSRINQVFPGLAFGVEALIHSGTGTGWLNLLFFALSALAAFLVLLVVGHFFYARTLLRMSSGSGSGEVLSKEKLSSRSRTQTPLMTMVLNETRMLLRTPAFFMNNVLGSVIMPVLLLVMPFFTGDLGLGDLREGLSGAFDGWAYTTGNARLAVLIALAAVVVYALSFGNIGMVTSTALSRKGNNAYVMKYIPQSYFVQFLAILIPGLVISLLPNLLVLIVIPFILDVPIGLILSAVVLLFLSLLLSNLTGFIFDILSPKLKWENETQAVKNNMNVMWTLGLGMLLAAVPIFLAVLVWNLEWTPLMLLLILIGTLGLSNLLVLLVLKNLIPKRMHELNL